MTLSPVFRSTEAVQMLEEQGIWKRLRPSIEAQADAVRAIYDDLECVIGSSYRQAPKPLPYLEETDVARELEFLQEYFFLILFRSIFESLGIPLERLGFYSELNFCIKGTITAADNIFDDQEKSLLPLRDGIGQRYMSIMQLMCFERLMRRACDRATASGAIDSEKTASISLGLMDEMCAIGKLEGSEEGGVYEIPEPEAMVENVHRIRGGALFSLAFVALREIETGETQKTIDKAQEAIAQLGTAFQIVDDLTDFEFDLGRKSHNLLVSQIHHCGGDEEKKKLDALWNGEKPEENMVEEIFRNSAKAVLDLARNESRAGFQTLSDLGYWFPVKLSDEFVHAIVGLDGVARMASSTS